MWRTSRRPSPPPKSATSRLAAEFDAIILEGAGSPGEVNLKSHDIVNMRMAEHAARPVLVVGDIDRGGVFASFVGTMEVLAPWERKLVAGWIVNRFRGDASLLGPALEYTLSTPAGPCWASCPICPTSVCRRKIRSSSKAARSTKPPKMPPAMATATARRWKSR